MNLTRILNNMILLVVVPLFCAATALYFDLPWWYYLCIHFVVSASLLKNSLFHAFFINAIGTFVFWSIYFYWINAQNQSILMPRLLPVLHVSSHYVLFLSISFGGAILSGIAGTLGCFARKIISNR